MSLTFSNISCAQNSCIPQMIQSVWLDPGARTQLQGRTSQGLFSGRASVPAWLTSTFLSFLLHPKQADCIQAAYREQSWYVVWPIRCPGGEPNPRWLMVADRGLILIPGLILCAEKMWPVRFPSPTLLLCLPLLTPKSQPAAPSHQAMPTLALRRSGG